MAGSLVDLNKMDLARILDWVEDAEARFRVAQDARDSAARERMRACYEAKLAGATYKQIAERLGVSRAVTIRLVKEGELLD